MTTVNQLLANKNKPICSIEPSATVYETLHKMAANDVGAIVVLESGKLQGLFTERDYSRKVVLKGKSSKEVKVGELMTHDLYFVTPDNTVEECMEIMTERHIRYLPVIQETKLVGLISIGDAVKTIISQQKRHIQDLEKYFTGDDYGFYSDRS